MALVIAVASLLFPYEVWSSEAQLTAAEQADRAVLERNLEAMLGELRERSVQNEIKDTGFELKNIPNEQIPQEIREMSFDELLEAVRFRQKVIYGTDDRALIHRVTDPKVKARARADVALIDKKRLTKLADDRWAIESDSFGESYELCADEPFRELVNPASCSGFLVATDIVVTAGHCVKTASSLNTIAFVFDFVTTPDGKAVETLAADQVFEATALLGREEGTSGADWAVVRLSSPDEGRTPVAVRRSGKVDDSQELYVLGHPSGLPLVHAPGAEVRENDDAAFFVANLDTYGGNSGSMVLNADDHVVEGILVRGEKDFVRDDDCYRSLVCPDSGCRGEAVTRISEVLHLLSSKVESQTSP